MVDIPSIAGMMSALKGATDIMQAIKTLRSGPALDAKIGELNAKILEAQNRAFAANDERASLIKHIADLEEELVALKDWEAEKKRYQLSEIAPGVFTLSIKEEMRGGEPFHHICANCAADGKKRYLQQHIRGPFGSSPNGLS